MPDNPSNALVSPPNMVAELAALARDLAPARGPKLTFLDRCAAFALLYQGIPQPIVAKLFGLSRASVSYIAGCVPIDNRQPVTIELEVTREATGPDGQILTLNPKPQWRRKTHHRHGDRNQARNPGRSQPDQKAFRWPQAALSRNHR